MPVSVNVTALPVESVLPDLMRALADRPAAVLEAPPGAGKSTHVPLALLGEPWLGGKSVVLLEPRRLAAKLVATRLAQGSGQPLGQTVGYRIRLERKISAATKLEVVTEGILTRRLQGDPELTGVGLVIFDEFHERSLETDLGLALCLEIQKALRPDLRLLVMSATLDGQAVAKLMGEAPLIRAEGRLFPVELRYLENTAKGRFEDDVTALIRRALAEETGSLLAFLPGEGEIRRVAERLAERGLPPGTALAPLYGQLSLDEQERAIRPAPQGQRKIVLATTIAETSLTIEGIRVVVDGGLKRVARFDPNSGLTRLETVKVSRAAAQQRAGRAGRLEPGVAYRLWTEAEDRALEPFDAPTIRSADLAPLALELAQWGESDPAKLAWLDPPPAGAYAQALGLLRDLDALDEKGRITAEGRALAALPLHPRLAHMVVKGKALGLGGLACDLAALLSERDILTGTRDADLRTRLELIADRRAERPQGAHLRRDTLSRLKAQAADLRRQAGIGLEESGSAEEAGRLLAFAYPDRIGQRRGGRGEYRLANGKGARLAPEDPLAGAEFLVAADLDGKAQEARIFLAAPIERATLESDFDSHTQAEAAIGWNERAKAVESRRTRKLGALILDDKPLPNPDPWAMAQAMAEGVRKLGLAALPWTKELQSWRDRVRFLAHHRPGDGWPDLADEALLAALEDWLGPYLAGVTRAADLARIDLAPALFAKLDRDRARKLERLAPSHLAVPTGSRIALDYADPKAPVLAVKLQEMFGQKSSPAVLEGALPVVVHLLSPAGRPLAVTRDLASFWANAYPLVRAEMRGRYPKHPWPDDPLSAPPTRHVKKRSGPA